MFALAAAAVTHGSIKPSVVSAIILAVALAAFWKSLIKIGLALLAIGILVMIVGGLSAVIHLLRA